MLKETRGLGLAGQGHSTINNATSFLSAEGRVGWRWVSAQMGMALTAMVELHPIIIFEPGSGE
jgi:hypothetical protein